MSQYAPVTPQAAPTGNAMGMAGFIVSLLGLILTLGLLSPIGLILSLIGLGREPKGFAIAGVIIGLIGTCTGVFFLIFGVLGLLLTAVGLAAVVAISQTDQGQIFLDMGQIVMRVEEAKDRTGSVPADLSQLSIQSSALIDPWGNSYRYVVIEEDPGYDIISDGPDGVADTEDDVEFLSTVKGWDINFDHQNGINIHFDSDEAESGEAESDEGEGDDDSHVEEERSGDDQD